MLTKLDKSVKSIFDTFKIDCFGDHGQIKKVDLGYTQLIGDHLEFDFVARINRIGLIIEVTGQANDNREKVRKFIDNCQEFIGSTTSLPDKIKLLKGIPARKRRAFHNIKEWKFVYLSTSEEIIKKNLTESEFPNSPLIILNREHYEYLKFLSNRLGEFGKYEFLNKLSISSSDAGESKTIVKEHVLMLSGRKISEGMTSVDLFVFTLQVSNMLKISRVIRYGSLEAWSPEIGTTAYQRLLNPEKLKKIRLFLKEGRGLASFPNAVIVVLSSKVSLTSSEKELLIPLEYGSLEVIDGQHRLFAYAKSGLKAQQLDEARLIVIGLRFQNCPENLKQRWAAKAFVEINRSQTKVPTELIQLIANSVMGEKTPSALAARAIVELNIKSGPLNNVFSTRPFLRKNRVKGRPVRLVTVTKEIEILFDKRNINDAFKKGLFESFPEEAWSSYAKGKPEKILDEVKSLLDKYFGFVSKIFTEDWGSNESMIFTSKYLAAFCRLLIECKKRKMNDSEIQEALKLMKRKIDDYQTKNRRSKGPNKEVLWFTNSNEPEKPGCIPSVRGSFKEIYTFLSARMFNK